MSLWISDLWVPRIPPTVDFLEHFIEESTGSTMTFNYPSLSTGFHVVMVAWRNDNIEDLDSATVGGVSATIVGQNDNGGSGTGRSHSAILSVNIESAPANNDIFLDFGGERFAVVAGLYRLNNLKSLIAHDSDFPAGGGEALRTATVDVPEDGIVIGQAFRDTTSWTSGVDLDSSVNPNPATQHILGSRVLDEESLSHDVQASCSILSAISWR